MRAYIMVFNSSNKRAVPYIRTSVLLSPEFYNLCKDNRIQFSEAIRVGISIMLSERGITDYDNKLNLYRKMMMYKEQLEKLLDKGNKEIIENKEV